MLRVLGGIVVGVVVWFVVISVLDYGLKSGWHDYAVVEKALTFTLPMMAARLSESAVSSLISGYLAALVERRWAPLIAGIVLLGIFAPEHYMLLHKFPLWYHLTFLISLPLLSFIGGRLRGGATHAAAA